MNGKPLHRASKNKTCSYLFYLTSVTRPKGPSNLTFTVDVITLMTFFVLGYQQPYINDFRKL